MCSGAHVSGTELGPWGCTQTAVSDVNWHKTTCAVVPMRLALSWGPGERLAFATFCSQLAVVAAGVVDRMTPKQLGQVKS